MNYLLVFRTAAINQAQNLQQAPMPMSPQPGQTGRGASVVSDFPSNYTISNRVSLTN